MKTFKSFIFLSLAGALLLTAACGPGNQNGNENTDETSGRYVETDITPPIGGRFMSFLDYNGAIVCFDVGLVTRYDSADGGANWIESPGPGRKNDRYQNVGAGALLPGGNILAFIQDEGLISIAPDGSGEPYPIEDIDNAIAEGSSVMVSLLKSLGSDRLLICYIVGGIMMQSSEPGGQDTSDGQPRGSVIGSAPVGRRLSGDASNSEGSARSGDAGNSEGSTRSGYSFSGNMVSKTLLFELSTGRLIADLHIENAAAVTAGDAYLYHMDMYGNVMEYSLADGSASNNPTVSLGEGNGGISGAMLSMIGSAGDTLAVNEVGDLYALYNRNLLLCCAGGDIETILEGTAYSIGTPNSTADSVFAPSDGSIIVNMLEGMQTNRLYKYAWDENAEINPEKKLSVWSLEENAFVRAAIADLRKKNPDSYITYEVALTGDNAASAADAIKTLNTQLLSGKGPDVILLDGCPAGSYANKGMLLDLSGLVDTGGIYQNLLATYVNDGKIFYLPTQFVMPALIGQSDVLDKIQSLDDLVGLVVIGNGTSTMNPGSGPFTSIPEDERAELYFEDLEELNDIMWLSAAPAIVKENRLDMDALKRYLGAIKAISDKYGLAETGDGSMTSMSIGFSSGGQTSIVPGSLVRYTSQMTNLGAFAADNLTLLELMMERDGSEISVFPGLVPGAWRPLAVAGISADSSVVDFAVELLRTMLSIEVQRINYGAGLPVTRDGIAEQIADINSRRIESDRKTYTIDMDGLINSLREPSAADAALTDMMWSSVEKLCMGITDVEEAAKEIEQNVKNYLAERA